ncbi:hypothetical protein K474DRAFT_1602967 [Panus rudis PR-1116 ss-1]|nr:hypothetical protein K474DRAFT_1602967 [Panus rudis PR-1116 ss-1]
MQEIPYTISSTPTPAPILSPAFAASPTQDLGPPTMTSMMSVLAPAPGPLGGLQTSLEELDLASHAARKEIVAHQQSDKGTSTAYSRHLANYLKWWATYQADEDKKNPARVAIPAEPITAAKVAMFLQHESSRPKRKRRGDMSELQEGTTVGRSAISQAISALERHRSENAHLYKADREAQVPLRLDNRVRAFEEAAKHNEPKRIAQAQVLKASGTSAGKY